MIHMTSEKSLKEIKKEKEVVSDVDLTILRDEIKAELLEEIKAELRV